MSILFHPEHAPTDALVQEEDREDEGGGRQEERRRRAARPIED